MSSDDSRPETADEPATPATGDDATTGDDAAAAEEGFLRRHLLKILIAVALGVPLAVEGGTLLGLLTGAGEERAVDLGDELLPGTPQTETVVDSSVHQAETWTYQLSVEVDNGADAPYSLTLGPLYTEGNGRVAGTHDVDVPAGETRTLEAVWEIPAAATPNGVDALATWSDQRVETRVALSKPAVFHD